MKEIFLQLEELKDNVVSFQVIVIDDGSLDGSGDWIRSNYPKVLITEGDGNLWWSGSINEGARLAFKDNETTHVLWWNNDIIPEKDYFRNLVEILGGLEDNVIIGSKIYVAENPEEIWAMGGVFNPVKGVKIFAKLEYMNPGGSVKDRPALWMIKRAEEKGILKSGMKVTMVVVQAWMQIYLMVYMQVPLQGQGHQ